MRAPRKTTFLSMNAFFNHLGKEIEEFRITFIVFNPSGREMLMVACRDTVPWLNCYHEDDRENLTAKVISS